MAAKQALMPHQREAIDFAKKTPRAIFAHEMRLGKTRAALETLIETGDVPALIVVPAHLRWVWKEQAAQWAPALRIQVLETLRDEIDTDDPVDAYICSYEWAASQPIPLLHFITLILDESHYVKSPDAKRTEKLMAVAALVDRVILLSGTIMPNRPKELWVPLRMTRALQQPYYDYTTVFCAGHKTHFGWDDNGASNTDRLAEIFRTVAHVRTQKEVLADLPAVTRQIIPLGIDFTTGEHELIESVKDFDLDELNAANPKIDFEAMSTVRHWVGQQKVKAAVTFIHDVAESEPKVVVFAWHIDVIAEMQQELTALGHRVVTLTGADADNVRQERVAAFMTNPEVTILIGQLKAAGTGVALHAAAVAVFVEADWVPGNLDQAEARIQTVHGKPVPLTYYYLVANEGGLDEYLLRRTLEKREIIEETVQ